MRGLFCAQFLVAKTNNNFFFFSFSSNEFEPKNLVVGSVYCTFNQKLYEWHRCEILRINERDALVFYIDIGTKDLMPIKALKTLKVNHT